MGDSYFLLKKEVGKHFTWARAISELLQAIGDKSDLQSRTEAEKKEIEEGKNAIRRTMIPLAVYNIFSNKISDVETKEQYAPAYGGK